MNTTEATATATLILKNPKNGEELASPFATDLDARARLNHLLATREVSGNFATSIFSASRGRLSASQQFWLHKLAMNTPKPAPKPTEAINLEGLETLLSRGKGKLKNPAIVLAVTSFDEIKLSIAGPRSKYAGSIMVASPSFGGAYYGRVTSGMLFPGRDFNSEVRDLLHSMSKDPAATAAAYGHMTGKCCFCNRKLEDERSTEVGYGSTCARNYGLPWGRFATI